MGSFLTGLFRSAPVAAESPAADDAFNLQRFVCAQEDSFERALREVEEGSKRSHWMWYVFPQFDGLGRSSTARFFAISGAAEAEAYLAHPVLGARLEKITRALLALDGSLSAHKIFGSPDDLKLRSCMTLFSSISEEGNVFERVLDKYFDGKPCYRTLELLYGKARK